MPRKKKPRRETHATLERVLYIDEALRRKKTVNCSTICARFGVERHAVLDDVAFLRDRWNRPLDFDPARNTYYYLEEVEPLPDLVITEGELFSFMAGCSAVDQYRGTPYHGQLVRAAAKLASRLKTKVSFSVDAFARLVSFRGTGRPKIDPGVFELLSRASARGLEVSFDYRKPGETAPRSRTVQIWHLTYRGYMWYAIGYDAAAAGRRTFALPRITNPVLTERRFERPEDFSVDDFFANAFSVMGGDGDHRVVIRFRAGAAVRVQECEWHESEKWRPLDDGRVELELRLGALEEIERWVLSWGAEAEVLEPQPLRDRIAATLAALSRAYGAGG